MSQRPPAGQRLAMKRHRGEAIASVRYQEVYVDNSKQPRRPVRGVAARNSSKSKVSNHRFLGCDAFCGDHWGQGTNRRNVFARWMSRLPTRTLETRAKRFLIKFANLFLPLLGHPAHAQVFAKRRTLIPLLHAVDAPSTRPSKTAPREKTIG